MRGQETQGEDGSLHPPLSISLTAATVGVGEAKVQVGENRGEMLGGPPSQR